MRKHLRLGVKAAVFIALLALVLHTADRILFFKQTDLTLFGNTPGHLGFYKMERDSVDVLFLGSSFGENAFSPQEIYNETGIRSYNLCSGQQSVLLSYYLLKEALRYQTPKAVVMESYLCFTYNPDDPLNTSELALRVVMDAMKLSPVKIQAVKEIAEIIPGIDPLSYFLLNLRFHDRWHSLNENDFCYEELSSHNELKGYTAKYIDPIEEFGAPLQWQPFAKGDSDERIAMMPTMEEYLQRIVDLCKEKGIRFALTYIPRMEPIGQYNTLCDFAERNQIALYDFNEKELFEDIGFDTATDAISHLNICGMQKVSRKIAHILQDDLGVAPVRDEQYESTREIYAHAIKRQALAEQTDLLNYLEMLHDENYSVFFAVNGDASAALTPEIVQAMQSFGLAFPLEGEDGSSYCAAVTRDGTFEKAGLASMAVNGSFRNGRTLYTVSSSGRDLGNTCSISIDRVEYALKKPGLNIVVYDDFFKKVIDSVCFDLSVPVGPEEIPCTRG